MGDAFAIHNVKLSFAERGRSLVLDHFDFGARACYLITFLNSGNAANIHAHGGVELEGATAGGRLRVAEHDPDLLPDLVDEYQAGARLGDNSRQLAQGL